MFTLALSVVAGLSATEAQAGAAFLIGETAAPLASSGTKMVIARDGNKTVVTVSMQYKGDARRFAMVVALPKPVALSRARLLDPSVLDVVDKRTAPSMDKVTDADPCTGKGGSRASLGDSGKAKTKLVPGTYDLLLLSERESAVLPTWLETAGYKVPPAAAAAFAPYLKAAFRFAVVRVDMGEPEAEPAAQATADGDKSPEELAEEKRTAELNSALGKMQRKADGFATTMDPHEEEVRRERMKKQAALTRHEYLRALQFEFKDDELTVPLRLGLVNAPRGRQDVTVVTLMPKTRALANYAMKDVPVGGELPGPAATAGFYEAVLARAKGGLTPGGVRPPAVFVEFAGVGLTLKEAALFGWEDSKPPFVTRMLVKLESSFKDDLTLKTGKANDAHAAKFTLRAPFEGAAACAKGKSYRSSLPKLKAALKANLSKLTGWSDTEIARREKGK